MDDERTLVVKAIRLDKWLANAGMGTRTEVKKAIRAARIEVNGAVAKDPGQHVVPGKDDVTWDGESISYQMYVYFLMYKPQGVLSATEDLRDPVVTDLLEPEDAHFDVFPVGRLDKDAEGLLILTNDGQLAHRLLSPKHHVPKRYLVHVEGRLGPEDVAEITKGITLEDGYQALPGDLTILESGRTSVGEIVIYEGKYHQVKRMFGVLGKPVIFLKRLEMGPISLDETLQPGEYRAMTEGEIASLKALQQGGTSA
ncbi:rRNA pseudouridine synthase [Alicyclobacillus fastidiosus]|uniref:Pseudouridine synthase n=1 Tax=Alicyclobacillus fastidiosus TaxID=392011 RepID=A0ABY6ZIF9_9BACL|nr:pseudouridine synthase [Alicyclobacillus fastidiosus]WAH42616.1 rRNA pseudouridine synthase [Alicyclobacillus fastidiosus]